MMIAGQWCSTPMLAGDCRARKQARRHAWVGLRIKTEEMGVASSVGTSGQGQRELVQLFSSLSRPAKKRAGLNPHHDGFDPHPQHPPRDFRDRQRTGRKARGRSVDRELCRGSGRDRRIRRRRRALGYQRAFCRPPDQASIRELVGLAAGDGSREIAFDTVEAKDWVKATPRRTGRRSAPAASSCTASMTAPACRPTSSASRSRRRWRSAPAITAPRAAACCCSIMC